MRIRKHEFPDSTISRQIGVLEHLLSQTLESLLITHGALRMHAARRHRNCAHESTIIEQLFTKTIFRMNCLYRFVIVSVIVLGKYVFAKNHGTNSIAWPQGPISHMLGASGNTDMMAGILGYNKNCQTRDAPSIVYYIMKACFIVFGGSLYRSIIFNRFSHAKSPECIKK